MRFSRFNLRSTFHCVAMFTAFGLSGCGNSCFVGVVNNGSGGIIVKAENPPPSCSLSQANGTISAVAIKSPVCESCTADARVKHVFVTLRSIQLRPSASDETNPSAWLELAPHLTKEPRQIDLMGNSMSETLVKSAIVPAGSYREVRLQFFSGSPTSTEELLTENACGETRWNCVVLADGRIEPLRLTGDVPELLIPFQNMESDSFVVLPDARMNLRLSLKPHQRSYFSSSEGWTRLTMLVGNATAEPQSSNGAED